MASAVLLSRLVAVSCLPRGRSFVDASCPVDVQLPCRRSATLSMLSYLVVCCLSRFHLLVDASFVPAALFNFEMFDFEFGTYAKLQSR